MEHNTHRTPKRNRNGQRIDTMSVGVRVASRHQEHIDNVEIHYRRRRPVGTCTDRGQFEPMGAEWRHISTTDARHTGMVGQIACPFSTMADTASEKVRLNRRGTTRHQDRKKIVSVRIFLIVDAK